MTKYVFAILAVSGLALAACGGGSGEGAQTPEGQSAAPAGTGDPAAAPAGTGDPAAAPPADTGAAPAADAPKH